MGGRNKLHLPVAGTPLLRRSVDTLVRAQLGEILVVLGHESANTRVLLEGLPVSTVYNDDYASGQMTSVHCGLAALSQDCDGVMVALGDQPALAVSDIDYLVEAFYTRDGGEVVIPQFNGQRGNPLIISSRCRGQIVSGKTNLGCRRFIENNPELVRSVEMPGPSVVIDLDTPVEYSSFCDSITAQHDTPKQQQAN